MQAEAASERSGPLSDDREEEVSNSSGWDSTYVLPFPDFVTDPAALQLWLVAWFDSPSSLEREQCRRISRWNNAQWVDQVEECLNAPHNKGNQMHICPFSLFYFYEAVHDHQSIPCNLLGHRWRMYRTVLVQQNMTDVSWWIAQRWLLNVVLIQNQWFGSVNQDRGGYSPSTQRYKSFTRTVWYQDTHSV